jgi:hypothetical protein
LRLKQTANLTGDFNGLSQAVDLSKIIVDVQGVDVKNPSPAVTKVSLEDIRKAG